MNSQVEALVDRLGTDLNTLRIDALTGIRTSILGQAMEAPYSKCNADYESEENPALRRRLEQEITVIKEQMGRIIDIMG
ncbi:hypothetical protein COL922a_012973 [Colletotrichum nupharicola]|nr:hypothetical protein COL922a_012973 [Colletotrichum nupharicola]